MEKTIDTIWSDLQNLQNETNQDHTKDSSTCKNCKGNNLQYVRCDLTCCDCGLVMDNQLYDNVSFTNSEETQKGKYNITFHRMSKMQKWYMWSNEEKNNYKLTSYTETLCSELNIPESLVSSICETVVKVLNTIKKYDGTKRARVKDGIILVCIHYVTKHSSIPYLSAHKLAKKLNLNIKYITKAESIVLELVNCGKLNLDRNILLNVKTPYDFVLEGIKAKKIKVSNNLINTIKLLIQICEKHDLLLDHTPLSIGVACFYYIITMNHMNTDIKVLSEIFDLSSITILKSYNKLVLANNIIEQYIV
jgi:transcription initiation factor TFIIIB Brf1 subunit/transcription initiation factor TFIIB